MARKNPPERIERFQHNVSSPFDNGKYSDIMEESYPDVMRFLPLRRVVGYKSDCLVPPKTTIVNKVASADGTIETNELPQPLVEWIVESSHAYECLLKRKTDSSGHRGRLIGHIIIPINPTTKKNSGQIIRGRRGNPVLIPSAPYNRYLSDVKKLGNSIWQSPPTMLLPLDRPLSISALYYRKDHRRCDITNLESALMDVLVSVQIIRDDNYNIVCNTDGSRVFIDKENPRTEVFIYEWKNSFFNHMVNKVKKVIKNE